jgi:hypothetical protein
MRWILALLRVIAGAGIGIAFAIPLYSLIHTHFDSALQEALSGSVGYVYFPILTLIPLGVAFVGGFFGYKLCKRLR